MDLIRCFFPTPNSEYMFIWFGNVMKRNRSGLSDIMQKTCPKNSEQSPSCMFVILKITIYKHACKDCFEIVVYTACLHACL